MPNSENSDKWQNEVEQHREGNGHDTAGHWLVARGIHLCAGMAAAESMKLLLQRGTVMSAPQLQQFDADKCKYATGAVRWGNRGPLQRAELWLFRRLYRV